MATYNEVTLTFTNDWIVDDILKINSSELGLKQWTWVLGRSDSYEVTKGTPTGNAGEKAAINFKAAFDLDHPTGYTTTVQNDNEVLIQSETIGEDWVSISLGGSNTGTLTYVIDNGETPVPVAAFSGTPLTGSASLSVTFTDSSTNSPTSWAWTFGDGGTSTDQNPTKIYTSAGTYDVGLTATNDGGSDIETKVGYITVSEAPAPSPEIVDIIQTKSPHYINVPFVYETTTKVDLSLYIWEGNIALPPSSATVELEKIRPTVDYAEFNLDIGNIVNDYLAPLPNIENGTGIEIINSTSSGVQWVKYEVVYTDDTETIDDIEGTLVALDGYGFYSDGVNPSVPDNKVLTDCANRKVSRNGYVLLPFANETTITNVAASTEGTDISFSEAISEDTDNDDYIKYLYIDVGSETVSDEYITVTVTTTSGTHDYIYEIVDECRYTPKNVLFKNKYGAWELVTMFKKESKSMDVQSDEFVNNYVSSGTYSTSKHEIQRKNITAKQSVSLNSGYISEDENDLYEQLLLSDQVYFYSSSGLDPVNVKSRSIEFMTRVNDKLVKYNIDFEKAYNLINRV